MAIDRKIVWKHGKLIENVKMIQHSENLELYVLLPYQSQDEEAIVFAIILHCFW